MERPSSAASERLRLIAGAAAQAETLRARGVNEPAASLTAEMGTAVIKVTSERWVGDSNKRDRSELICESLDELKAVAA